MKKVIVLALVLAMAAIAGALSAEEKTKNVTVIPSFSTSTAEDDLGVFGESYPDLSPGREVRIDWKNGAVYQDGIRMYPNFTRFERRKGTSWRAINWNHYRNGEREEIVVFYLSGEHYSVSCGAGIAAVLSIYYWPGKAMDLQDLERVSGSDDEFVLRCGEDPRGFHVQSWKDGVRNYVRETKLKEQYEKSIEEAGKEK